MATKIQLRHDTSAAWTAADPILAEGEMGIETDTQKSKVGNGSDNWSALQYMADTNFKANYVSKAGDATAQVITGTGGLKTDGLLESRGGVEISGGNDGDITCGLAGKNGGNQVNLIANATTSFLIKSHNADKQCIALIGSPDNVAISTNGTSITTIPESLPPNKKAIGLHSLPRLTDSASNSFDAAGDFDFIGIQSTLRLQNPNTTPYRAVRLFNAEDFYSNRNSVYGYYSSISLGTGTDRYNFYGQGTAPNFFAGDTYIGGTTARNTFELWKSTLTEEQLEQLEAGTYAAPANVSTPGDGSFARAWYYDQQDEETQLALDSGELEYPEHLAAATFTDTFTLGKKTNIILSANGSSLFKGYMEIQSTTPTIFFTSANGAADNKTFLFKNENSGTDLTVQAINDAGSGSGSLFKFTRDGNIVESFEGLRGGNTWFEINNLNKEVIVDGLVESKGGVKVSGGSSSSVTTGLVNSGNNLDLVHKGQDAIRLFDDGTTRCWSFGASQDANIGFNVLSSPAVYNAGGNQTQNGSQFRTDINDSATHITNVNSIANVSAGSVVESLKMFSGNGTTVVPASGNNFDEQIVYYAGNTSNTDKLVAVNNYGFYSSIFNSSIGKNNYSFYAAGSAPNYFAGYIHAVSNIYSSFNPENTGLDKDTQPEEFFNLTSGSGFFNCYCPGGGGNSASKYVGVLPIGDAGTRNAALFYQMDANGNNGRSVGYIAIKGNGGLRINCGVDGEVQTTSDYRLKTNIADMTSATTKIKQLRPVSFDFINGSTGVDGFIAHELQTVVPRAVSGVQDEEEAIGTLVDYDGTTLRTNVTQPESEDLTYEEQVEATPYVAAVEATYDEDGNELTPEVPEVEATYTTVTRTKTWTPTGTQPVYQGVDQTKLIPLLTKALQEALDKIETLETRLSDAGIA